MSFPPNQKHAFLIMAHHNFAQLQTLIRLLDDPRNDIYLHVDKKSASFCPESICTVYSDLVMVDRISVIWGGHSQIECELNLLRAAAPKHYQYYHLLSGADLPLRTPKEMHAFFDRDPGKNYIDFDARANETGSFLDRIYYYHLLQNVIGRKEGVFFIVLRKIQKLIFRLMAKTGLHRKQYIPAYKGANWFSINDDLAQYVLSQEHIIRKQFYYSKCADEVFLQSLAMASPYKDSVVPNALRSIDWERGTPYTYRLEDVDDLLASDNLFARKFDENIDRSAINKIAAHVSDHDDA